jgi:hypothetical protein
VIKKLIGSETAFVTNDEPKFQPDVPCLPAGWFIEKRRWKPALN